MALRYTVFMSHAQKIHRLSVAEYLAYEQTADVRHEYVDGELFAMAGASRAHAMIVTNLLAALRDHLRGTPCRVLASDIKVWIETLNRFYYPDLVVSCSDITTEPDDHFESQPRLIVEVLSDSTAATDRREKRLAYQTVDSLQDYVLVAQAEPLVEVYHRQPDGWIHTTYGAGETVALPSVNLQVAMAVIYEDVPLASGNA